MKVGEFHQELRDALVEGICPACCSHGTMSQEPVAGFCVNVKCSFCGNKYTLGQVWAQWIGWEEACDAETS